VFTDEGKEINQKLNSRAGLAVGSDVFSNVRFTGTLFVNTNSDDDAVGFLFGYQNNKNFYTVTSSKSGTVQVLGQRIYKTFCSPGILEAYQGKLHNWTPVNSTSSRIRVPKVVNVFRMLFSDWAKQTTSQLKGRLQSCGSIRLLAGRCCL
jgi:hypothetical protein